MGYVKTCEADQLALGWRPGFTYFSAYWREAIVVLGYDRHGSVIVRDVKTGVERSHMTRRGEKDRLCVEVDNIFGWSPAVVRQHRENAATSRAAEVVTA